MYGVGCHLLGTVNQMPLLTAIGHVEVWGAVAAWALTFAGFIGKVTGWSKNAARPPVPAGVVAARVSMSPSNS